MMGQFRLEYDTENKEWLVMDQSDRQIGRIFVSESGMFVATFPVQYEFVCNSQPTLDNATEEFKKFFTRVDSVLRTKM